MIVSNISKESAESSLGFASLGQLQEYAVETNVSNSVASSKKLASLAFFAICKSPVVGENLTTQVTGDDYDNTMVRPTLLNLNEVEEVLKNSPLLVTCTSGFGPSSLSFLECFVDDRRQVLDNIDRQLA